MANKKELSAIFEDANEMMKFEGLTRKEAFKEAWKLSRGYDIKKGKYQKGRN